MKKNIKIVITKNTNSNNNISTSNEIIDSYIDNIYKKDEKEVIYNLQYLIIYIINNIQNIIKKYISLIILIFLFFYFFYTKST